MRVNQGQEFVIGGYAPSPKNFDALIMTAISCGLLSLLLCNISLVPTAKAQDLTAGVQGSDNNDENRSDRPCSLHTLRGSYGSISTGTVVGVGPIAVLIQIKYDGAENYTQSDRASINGAMTQRGRETGTYTVNPDCSGSQTIFFPGGSPITSDFVIVNHGKEIVGLVTINGYTITFDSKKQ
jgi:hypothetical protein